MIKDTLRAMQLELGKTVGQNVPPSAYGKYIDEYLEDFIQMTYVCIPKEELEDREHEVRTNRQIATCSIQNI